MTGICGEDGNNMLSTVVKAIILPNKPMITCIMAATDMAPDSTRIRVCHNSVLFSNDIPSRISGSGHFHSGMFRMASTGTRSDMVPPCTIGNLHGGIKHLF